jgi:hypothetical protein
MGVASWESRGFSDVDIIHLCTNNKEVLNHNNKNILKVSNPIALVESENTANAKSISDENFGNLSSSMYLCISVKVTLTRNHLNIGLSNDSIGIAKEIVYDNNKPVPALSKFILVDFGESYMGASFFLSNDDKNG